jgi:uncharacterized protein YozE (UPF0346 family)
MKVLISVSSNGEYMYGMRIRPFSIGTQPKGHTRFIAVDNIPRAILDKWREPDYRFGVLVYPHPLSERDIEHYNLTDLNAPSHAESYKKFVDFLRERVEYEVEFDDLWNDYIHPRGELRTMNPLHEMPTNEFFSLLQKHGYPGRAEGLRKLYESL